MKSPLPSITHRRCGNCLSVVSGVYCSQCGQRQKSMLRHFRQLASDFFNDVLNLDTKLVNTLKPLLYNPGFLSLEYFAERRTRYVTPVKLYFILSVLAFFLIQLSVDMNGENGDLITVNTPATAKDNAGEQKPMSEEEFPGFFNFGSGPWHAHKNPVAISWLPDAGNDLINTRLGRLDTAIRTRDWMSLVHTALSATPPALILMLPFFALLLKLVYVRRQRLYMEHLIVALHNHAFLLLAISLLLIGTGLWNWLAPKTPGTVALGELVLGSLLAWIPLYFFLGLKRIYRQGWRKTGLKFAVIGTAYLFLIVLVLFFVLFLSIIMI